MQAGRADVEAEMRRSDRAAGIHRDKLDLFCEIKFAQRLKQKDEGRTWNVRESSSRKSYEETVKRLMLEDDAQDELIPQLKKQSRLQYLEKRKDDKVREDREHKKNLLTIAKEQSQRYRMTKDIKNIDEKEHVEIDEREKMPGNRRNGKRNSSLRRRTSSVSKIPGPNSSTKCC